MKGMTPARIFREIGSEKGTRANGAMNCCGGLLRSRIVS